MKYMSCYPKLMLVSVSVLSVKGTSSLNRQITWSRPCLFNQESTVSVYVFSQLKICGSILKRYIYTIKSSCIWCLILIIFFTHIFCCGLVTDVKCRLESTQFTWEHMGRKHQYGYNSTGIIISRPFYWIHN